MVTCAIDYCELGNWYSPALLGLRNVVVLDAAADAGVASELVVNPYSVLQADMSMAASVAAASAPVLGGVQCGVDCCDLSVRLSVSGSGVAASSLSAFGYVPGELSMALGGASVMVMDASVVVHPFCCDWSSSRLRSYVSQARSDCYVEAVTSGQVTFMLGDVALDACVPCGPVPFWRSGVAWYGEVQSRLCIDGDPVCWPDAAGAVASGLSMQGVLLGFAGARLGVAAGLSVSAYAVQWGRLAESRRLTLIADGLPDADEVSVIKPRARLARSYQPVQRVPVVDGEVLVVLEGVSDIVSVAAAEYAVGYTGSVVSVIAVKPGDVFGLAVTRANGAALNIKVVAV